MNNLKISTRLAYAFGLIVLVCLLSAVLAMSKLSEIQGNLRDVVQVNNVKIKLNNDMSEAVHVVSRIMRTIILLEDPAEKQREYAKLLTVRQKYDQAVEALEKFPPSEAAKAKRLKIAEAAAKARALNSQVL